MEQHLAKSVRKLGHYLAHSLFYRPNKFEAAIGRAVNFVQDNHSRSLKGVLRGLHYQLPPHAQAKLVRCTLGEVFDVAVDIRRSSSTFLSAENKRQLWIPEGFAHGFITLSDAAEFLYKTTDYYAPQSDACIMWDDTDIGIAWPIQDLPQLSPKDQQGKSLKQASLFV